MPPPSSPGRLRRSASSDSVSASDSSAVMWKTFDPLCDESDLRRVADEAERLQAADVTPLTTPELASQPDTRGQKRKADVEDINAASPKMRKSVSDVAVFDTDDGPFIISDPGEYRKVVHQAGYAIQWEIARQQNAGNMIWDIIGYEGMVALAEKSDAEGIAVLAKKQPSDGKADFESAFSLEKGAKDPWVESDREREVMRLAKGSPFYLSDPQDNNWFGGKIHYGIRLTFQKVKSKGPAPEFVPRLQLERACLGTSDQITRRFGSHSVVRVRMNKNAVHGHGEVLRRLFLRPFVIGGHVFRAFNVKEHAVQLIMTNETVEELNSKNAQADRTTKYQSWCSGQDFLEFINWYNPLQLNSEQTMAKWSARLSLGLSTSIPGIRIDPTHLHHIPDIVSEGYKGEGKAPADLTMTDGCGLANYDFFRALQHQFHWRTVPLAVQMRLNGAKGLLLQHPEHFQASKEGRPEVWIRASQLKIKYPPNSGDPALFTLDFLRAAHLSYPASLSTETIINFAENGVSLGVIKDLSKTGLQEKVDGLTTWSHKTDFFTLWYNLSKEGGVVSARLARERPDLARAHGWVFDDDNTDDIREGEEVEAMAETSSAWWPDPISGCPSSLEETCMELLDAGFSPDCLPVLRAKLKEVVKKANTTSFSKYRVNVPMSCSAWAVPDPTGVLEAGEIYVESSAPLLSADGKTEADVIVGDVLITRHPCKVPSDVQKVKAVNRRELRGYKDLVVVSTKGHRVQTQLLDRHLLSMLGGGDYDGDRVQVFWNPELVDGFQPADPAFATPPKSVELGLEKNTESVESFLRRVPDTAPRKQRIFELQRVLLGPLQNTSLVGKYSTFWENAVYQHGYGSTEAIRLAYLFCAVLDGSKTGVTVKAEQWGKDKKHYEAQGKPAWKREIISPKLKVPQVWIPKKASRKFVMDGLREFLEVEKGRLEDVINERLRAASYVTPDADLVKPWNELQERATRSRELRKGRTSNLAAVISAHLSRTSGFEEADQGRKEELTMGIVEDLQKLLESKGDRLDELAEAIMKGVKEKRITWLEGSRISHLPIQERQDRLRNSSKDYRSLLTELRNQGFYEQSDQELLRYMASYAYLHDYEVAGIHWSRFPFDVAFRTLCEIKACAVTGGVTKTVTGGFYIRFMIHKKWLEVL